MIASAFMALKKLGSARLVRMAARHNKREIAAERGAGGTIDAGRSHRNLVLAGPTDAVGVVALADRLMKGAGVTKLRKDAVRAIELVFSLPARTDLDVERYFGDCATWAGGRFGGAGNILSADIHLDEAQPHCHVLVLPLVNGRMTGSDLFGGRAVLAGHQTAFHEAVAGPHGLRQAPARLSSTSKSGAIAAILRHLQESKDPVLKSPTWPIVRQGVERDPRPWLSLLNIEIMVKPPKPMRSMTAIFTSPGKGPKREHF